MNKRQKKKDLQKRFQEMLGEPNERTIEFKRPAKISTEDDIETIVHVMEYEFDTRPSSVMFAQLVLPKYAWWFILEAYLTKEKISFKKEKNENGLIYYLKDGFISVDKKGKYNINLNDLDRRPIELMLLQKGYSKSN